MSTKSAAEIISEILVEFSEDARRDILDILKENFCFYCGASHGDEGCECIWQK